MLRNEIILTKTIFEGLIEHLVFVEENADNLAGFYYPDLPEKRESMKKLFLEYVTKIEAVMEKIEVVDSIEEYRRYENLNEFPIAIIGSQVGVESLTDGSVTSLKLIHPDEHSRRKNEITYLSPMGRALLLRKTGSEFEVDIPEGRKRFRVRSVRLL